MSADTIKIIISIVFAAGIVVNSIRSIDRRVERIEKQLDDHIMPHLTRRD